LEELSIKQLHHQNQSLKTNYRSVPILVDMVSSKIEVTSNGIIKPSSPTLPQLRTLQLSVIDQFQSSVQVAS